MNHLIPSFNAGELSPRLVSRPDLDKYGAGCRVLQNFLIMPYGGVNRRPGTQFLGRAKYADRKARLLGFNFSVTTNFVLEFGDFYCRFWRDGAPVLDGDDAVLEIETPYSEEEVFEFQFLQVNDVLFIVHPDHPVHTLSRLADDDWQLQLAEWDWPAVLDPNTSGIKLTPSATTGEITLTASAPLFKEGHIGAYWVITGNYGARTTRVDLMTEHGTSGAISVIGQWDMSTRGTWNGTVYVERRKDSGSAWEAIRAYRSRKDRNITTNGTEEEQCQMRLRYEHSGTHEGEPDPCAYLEVPSSVRSGVVRIVEVVSETEALATVIKPLASTVATELWAEGAWSEVRGYPRTVCLHEQRLVFGGTRYRPQTLWGSKTGDFYNFELGTKDDDALAFTLASVETNAIAWMVSQQALCIGTAGDEYVLTASSDGAITPTNLQVKRQSHFGGKYAPALLANDVALFIQRQGRKIREFVYEFQKDGYVASDLTLLADHITEGGVVQTAFQQQPDSILWCVTGSGTLAGMTYERAQNVVGWHRHVTEGVFESVASIYSADGADEVWVIVKRGEQRFVERFDPFYRESLESADKAAWWYLDCAVRVEMETPGRVVTGLDHLEGRTVDLWVDGAAHPPLTVSEGFVTLENKARTVLVGLPYLSQLTPMPLDPGPMQSGTAQSRKFRVNKLVLRLYKSLGGEVETGPGEWDPVYSRSAVDPMDASPPVFTGDREVTIARGYEAEGTVSVRQQQPLPMTLLGIIPKYEISGT